MRISVTVCADGVWFIPREREMLSTSFLARHGRTILGLVIAASGLAANSAQAGIVSYAPITGAGFTITNITESNDLPGNQALYGAPSLTNSGHSITFLDMIHNPFTTNAANGTSEFLRGILSFTVTYVNPSPNTPNINVSESGTYDSVGSAYS